MLCCSSSLSYRYARYGSCVPYGKVGRRGAAALHTLPLDGEKEVSVKLVNLYHFEKELYTDSSILNTSMSLKDILSDSARLAGLGVLSAVIVTEFAALQTSPPLPATGGAAATPLRKSM